MNCSECAFGFSYMINSSEFVECRRHAPTPHGVTVIPDVDADPCYDASPVWPLVSDNDWCGEFQRSQTPTEPVDRLSSVVATHPLLTAEELAEHLNVSRAQVYNFMRRGLPSLKVGKSRRFRLSDVTPWLDQFSDGDQP